MDEYTTNPVGAPSGLTAVDLLKRFKDERTGARIGVRLPWQYLDRALGLGFAPGSMNILYGRPGTAKTWFAVNLAVEVFKRGEPCKYIPLEDEELDLAARALAYEADDWNITDRFDLAGEKYAGDVLMNQKERALSECRFVVDGMLEQVICKNTMDIAGGAAAENIVARVRDESQNGGLIIVDNVSQITFSGSGYSRNDSEEAFVQGLRGAVKNTNCAVLLVCHTKKMGPHDVVWDIDMIKGSGHFARVAQSIIALEYHRPRKNSNVVHAGITSNFDHNMTLHLCKVRLGGEGGRFAFEFGSDGGPRYTELGGILIDEK